VSAHVGSEGKCDFQIEYNVPIQMRDGALRASYRNSLERPEFLTPEKVYMFEVDLWSTAQTFQAGHCLRARNQ
jgi:predicted acyl esterase